MDKFILDQVEREARAHRLDANETMFFLRQLEQVEETLYEYDEKMLTYRQHIPVDNSINPGAAEATYRMVEKVGKAKVGKGAYAGDLPRADARSTEFTQKIRGITSSFGWTVDEIRNAAYANVPLSRIKSEAATRSIREQENDIAWNGKSDEGLLGFLSTEQQINTLGVAKTWSSVATPDEILQDVSTAIGTIMTQSLKTRRPNAMLLPIDQFLRLGTIPRATGSDVTVIEFILKHKSVYGIDTIDSLPDELDLAFTSGTEDGCIFYEKNPTVIQQRIPLEILIHPVQIKGFEFIFPVESRHGGTVIRYPLACLFVTGI
ncbi:DUF2184 domain-containing protein [Candidatus Pacearchaeota archaeon]|nr:DUF2184 domain-containing protein [Candidatus Pacearchaeota archaeon]